MTFYRPLTQMQNDFFTQKPIEEVGQIRHDILKIKSLRSQRLFAGKCQQLINQGCRPIGVLMNFNKIWKILIRRLMT